MKKLSLILIALMLAILPMMFACNDSETPSSQGSQGTESSLGEENIPDEPKSPLDGLSEKEKAFYILEMEVDDKGKTSADTSLTMELNYMGVEIEAEVSGRVVEIDTDDTYIDYTEGTTSMSMMGTTSVTLVKSGWMDGKMLDYCETDGELYYADYILMTKDEYLEDYAVNDEDTLDNFGLTRENCATVTCTQDENGNWVATFTDVSAEGLVEFEELVGELSMLFENELTDVTLTLTTDAYLKPLCARVDFEFSGENAPVIVLTADYTIGDEVQTPEIDWSEFTEYTEDDDTDIAA